ncbi:uncharacterized protein [Drosophila bipectinata]|uniref:uncharacterized protein n=1 Tax=Drosophila bipectinata TaxID=42026 RepID=UPI001C8A0F23|nr:uncharacterized protein LOC108131073 [Drosophila bipectinata]
MSRIECPTHLPELVRNLSCSINSSSSFSAEFALAHDVWNTRGSYTFKIRLGSFMSNRTSVDLDLCQALETLQSEHFLRLIADEFRRVANFPVSCPFKKNTRYHIDGFAISAKFIPSYAPELSFISDCMIFINRKQAFQLTIYGSLNRTRSNKKNLSTLG